jgi:uncharacterized protein YpuA (DUF1002 family)
MPNKPVKRPTRKMAASTARIQNKVPEATPELPNAGMETVANKPTSMNTLKTNLSGKRKAIFEILDDVKKVKPDDWKDPNQVENLAKNFASKLGLPVPEQRIKQFMNAYKDATKNGPNANVEDLVKKYGKNVDDKTLKEIKKFVPKAKD